MQIYLVGGAVRDQLLGLPVKEKDWVVVGATKEDMQAQGFKQVGKDFPVFLHPKTQEEYALARTERKKGHGYSGFIVHAHPSVTLEQDLLRRDLTINAIAQDENGIPIDPFKGREDLKKGILRHVSPAFEEDPLRVLRLARFAAKFPDFTVSPETKALCQKIVSQGEINYLTSERVWLEWSKVLTTKEPGRFIEILESVGAWKVLMPYCQDPGLDKIRINKLAKEVSGDRLFSSIGLYLPKQEFKEYLKGVAVPSKVKELAQVVYILYTQIKAFQEESQSLLSMVSSTDAIRRPERFIQAVEVVSILQEDGEREKILRAWNDLITVLKEVKPDESWFKQPGKDIGEALQEKRKQVIEAWQRQNIG